MHPAISQHRSGIAAICQRHGIRRLEAFGSAARVVDFNPDNSDADFLVEFFPLGGPRSGFGDPIVFWNISQNALPGLIAAVQGLLDESA